VHGWAPKPETYQKSTLPLSPSELDLS
jgi:hypothetical protein